MPARQADDPRYQVSSNTVTEPKPSLDDVERAALEDDGALGLERLPLLEDVAALRRLGPLEERALAREGPDLSVVVEGHRRVVWAACSVDPGSLAPRTGYYRWSFPNDGCYVWTDGGPMRVLFTNGSD
jgi:hypothetical protein